MSWSEVPAEFQYGAGVLLALVGTFLLARAGRLVRLGRIPDDPEASLSGDVYFLRNGKIVNMNFSAQQQLEKVSGGRDNENRLRKLLSVRFSDIDRLLARADREADMSLQSRDGRLQAIREVAGNTVRIEVGPLSGEVSEGRDPHSLDAARDELLTLRMTTEVAPFLLWRQNPEGQVVWANRAYVAAVAEAFGSERVTVWPLPLIFPALSSAGAETCGTSRRIRAPAGNKTNPAWYDCHLADIAGDVLCTAFRADEAVRSETRHKEFTQTLTKTFADLSIGLAIFDRSRRLALFNPALSDLTALPSEFLTSRPSLVSFLDKLREGRVMPEPRDYHAWRRSIAELESGAANGTYTETWTLPDGRTYRVAGRPHPDGAVALLFEDITAEMSLTRRFRAQIEQAQAAIDVLDDAVAIFSAAGEMTFSNRAYKELWGDDFLESPLGSTAVEATRRWHDRSAPTPVWGDFREFVTQGRDRSEWTAHVTHRDGRAVFCRFAPHKAGTTIAVFRPSEPAGRETEHLRRAI